MTLPFILQAWSVWPPLSSFSEQVLVDQQQALLSSVPANLKRRLSPLAKTVFCAISQCDNAHHTGVDCDFRLPLPSGEGWGEGILPVVFSSTHGELAKSLEIIKCVQAGEEISPTTFSLSVHNAIAGLFSIAFGNTAEITVLAPGEDGIASAFIEALGLLQEGVPEVLIVFYDEPLPDFYPAEPFQLSTDSRCAVALKIAKEGEGLAMQFQRGEQCDCSANGHSLSFLKSPHPSPLPKGEGDKSRNLRVYTGEQPVQLPLFMQFLSGTDRQLQINTLKNSWHWQKLDHPVGINNSEK